MHQDIRLLIELQDIDYWIGELERSKDYIPDIMKNLRDEIVSSAAELAEAKARLQQAQVEIKSSELSIAENKERLEKYQEQMLTIKTNKEYDALMAQMELAKGEIATAEDRYLALADEIEKLKTSITELEEKCQRIQKDNTAQLAVLQNEIDSVAGKMEERVAFRSNLKTKVPTTVMAIYERVRKGKGGDVVVRLRRGACGECYKSQPPQKIQEIKRGETLQTCSSCGRILVWEGDD